MTATESLPTSACELGCWSAIMATTNDTRADAPTAMNCIQLMRHHVLYLNRVRVVVVRTCAFDVCVGGVGAFAVKVCGDDGL